MARRLHVLVAEVPTREAIEFAEAYADGAIDRNRLEAASDQAQILVENAVLAQNFELAAILVYARRASAPTLDDVIRLGYHFHDWTVEHCHHLRDIFGNPLRPITFDTDWRTSTAVALASQMYESRDFSAMPILADALQDAGCDNGDILDHCRGPGPHVRGCWVVDLVLGKT
jgi:hypothetical protein